MVSASFLRKQGKMSILTYRNLYEYLCREGAEVLVFRNDKIDVAGVENLHPDILFISPGPGHPLTDSGASRDLIKAFAGKVPVIGVCMGLQCIYSVFGGEVQYAGEIVHGKTSTITHDGKGIFSGITQHVAVTRYHSLSGSVPTLPESLEVTARSDSGVIMGVRHKKYTVEGVQFHPESILTEEGRQMVRNILSIRGGTWDEVSKTVVNGVSANNSMSILDRIYAQRKLDVEKAKATPGKTPDDLQRSLELGLAPPLIDVLERLKESAGIVSLLAEVKRASPSKGNIGIDIHAPTQALNYANAGAAVISVLTEPHWFKGDIEDLALVRRAVDLASSKRPAILRKEFIFDTYQILEARLAGADTVLLIVKMLPDDDHLLELYKYSKSLGMEPLVEVSSADELQRAIKVTGSKFIGVNNRDLHSFNVDLSTTSNLVQSVSEDTLIAALSGITDRAQVEKYAKDGVKAILVGEALMRAKDPKQFIHELIGQ